MKIVSDNALKGRMSEYIHEVENTGEELLVTHDGQAVLKIISYQREMAEGDTAAEEQGSAR